MAIILMVVKTMLNKASKYGILFFVGIFSFFYSHSSIFAFNYGSELYNSGIYSATIPTITATPTSGSYNTSQLISLTSEVGNSIRYSTTEAPVNCSAGTLYISQIEIRVSQRIYAIACDSFSNVTRGNFTYVINPASVPYGRGYPLVISKPNTNQKPSTPQGATNPTIQKPTTTKSTKSGVVSAAPVVAPNSKQSGSGSKNNDIFNLQVYLNKNGYNIGVPDGVFGTKTKSAVTSFQKNNKLIPDGKVGPKTKKKMR